MLAGRRQPLRTQSPLVFLTLFAGLLLAACDIPTRGPDFSFRPQVSGPLIFEKTLLFLGPDATGADALIDTTDATFDSLFSVDPADDGVYIVQDLEGFDLIDINDIMEPVTVDPEDVVVTIGDLATQTFETSFDNRIDVLEADARQSPWLTPTVTAGRVQVPFAAGDLLTVPTNGVVDLSGADVERVRVTADVGTDVNRLSVIIANNLSVALTDGSAQAGTRPILVLETGSGVEIARTPFDRTPGPGETASAALDLSLLDIPADGRFVVDVSTPQGFGPIEGNPSDVELLVDMSPVRYSGFEMSSIPAAAAQASRPSLTLTADIDFIDLTTRSGLATVRITNTLPLAVQIQSLSVTNLYAVGVYPAGQTVFSESGMVVPANSAIEVPVSIGVGAISRDVNVELLATAQPTLPPTWFDSSDGLAVEVEGDLDVDVLNYRPQGEVFSERSTFAVSTTEVTFNSPSDFVEVQTGVLDIMNLVNGLDLTFEDVTISFPDILTPPFRPTDSLIVTFRGSADAGSGVDFSKLERNAPPRDVSVDLSGTRISALGNEVRYNVVAISETTSEQRAVAHDDEITTTVRASDLTLSRISAVAEPFSALLTDDVNGDGWLDPFVPGESVTSVFDDFGPLNDVSGLELIGAELSLNVTTTIAGDLKVYGILAGDDGEGNTVYLQGRSNLAVAPGDTMLQSFRIAGSPPTTDQVFAFPMTVQGAPGDPSTHTVVLNDLNSNISDFVSTLPSTLRFVGKVIVGAPGGRIEITQPSTLDMTVGVAVPLNVRGTFELRRTESANLSSLADLTDPEANFTTESATLTLEYTNGIPLGLQARLEFLDEAGLPTVSLPLGVNESIDLGPAPSDAQGYASGVTTGEADFGLADEDLAELARSHNLRLVITFAAPDPSSGRIRASDSIRLALRGDFRFNVSIGG